MKDRIEEEPFINDEQLSYVSDLIATHLPMVDVDEDGNFSIYKSMSSLITFKNRYSNKEINANFKYEDYKGNDEIQRIISGFGLDSEKFWYLLLFIFDYSYGSCLVGDSWAESPKEQLDNLINAIDDNTRTIDINGIPTFNKEAKLTLKIKGNHSITINNPTAIYYLAFSVDSALKGIEPESIMNISTEFESVKSKSNSVHIWFFSKMFLAFFELYSLKKIKSPNRANKPFSKKQLISDLIYFTRLSKNEKLLESDETLKGILNKYKNYKLNTLNSYYFEKWM